MVIELCGLAVESSNTRMQDILEHFFDILSYTMKYIHSWPQQYNVACTDRHNMVHMGNIESDQMYFLWRVEITDRNKRRACYPLYLHHSYFLYWTNPQSPLALIPHNAFPISLLSRKCTTESVPQPTTVRTVRLSVSEASLWELLFENYSSSKLFLLRLDWWKNSILTREYRHTARLLIRNSATVWQCSKVLQLQARFRTLTRPLVLAPYIFHEENWMFLFLSAPSNVLHPVCRLLSAPEEASSIRKTSELHATYYWAQGPYGLLSFICEWASVPQARGKWGEIPQSGFPPHCCKCASHPNFWYQPVNYVSWWGIHWILDGKIDQSSLHWHWHWCFL